MAIKAVIFDYGMVLSQPAEPTCYAELLTLTGLTAAEFDALYWGCPECEAYDEGRITGLEFWQALADRSGRRYTPQQVAEMNLLDAMMWTTANPAMVAWQQQLKALGIKTAILSNMGESIARNIRQEHGWVHQFDHQFWSHAHGSCKPHPEFYLHALWRLQQKPEEVLFLDDRPRNLESARALRLETHHFRGLQPLRQELAERLHDWALPLPEEIAL